MQTFVTIPSFDQRGMRHFLRKSETPGGVKGGAASIVERTSSRVMANDLSQDT
jgi:hypothetical protein